MSGEKTEQPTPKRLRDARNKGEVAKSQEVTSAAVVLIVFAYIWMGWDYILEYMRQLVLCPIQVLDQPFEHKYDFELELHGPANGTDLLVYGSHSRLVQYDSNGQSIVELSYSQPGLVALYPQQQLNWLTVETVTFPISQSQTVAYSFAEVGLNHYRLLERPLPVFASPSHW